MGRQRREAVNSVGGLDVIGGCLTELTSTSPTGIMGANTLYGEQYEGQVILALERKIG